MSKIIAGLLISSVFISAFFFNFYKNLSEFTFQSPAETFYIEIVNNSNCNNLDGIYTFSSKEAAKNFLIENGYQLNNRQIFTGIKIISSASCDKIIFSRMNLEKFIVLGIKVDFNSMSLQEYVQIPGIGVKLAEKIVEFKKRHGSFKSFEDILNIKGIGVKKLESIKLFAYLNKNLKD